MGKALYRKYRSKTLDDVIGQQHITTTLKNAIAKNTVSHAYLFTGPRGVGKTSVARLLAHEINEVPYDEDANYLDIIEIDAASNRRIDEIRELRDKVHIAPSNGKYKVYIIDEVHMLTREAFNALLKTLEEPPAHAIFILATTELHKVPATIISRTQKFTFRTIDQDAVASHLRMIADKEKIPITDAALRLLSNHGQGSFRDSISMLDQIAGFSQNEITQEDVASLLGVPQDNNIQVLLNAVDSQDIQALFESVQALRESGAQCFQVARSIISLVRQQLANNASPRPSDKSIILMKELLPLSGSSNSFEALEIALLSCFSPAEKFASKLINENDSVKNESISIQKDPSSVIPQTVNKMNQNSSRKILKSEKHDQTNTLEINVEKKPVNLDKRLPKSDSEKWHSLLESLKATHNTLYGFLRMARLEESPDALTLYFKFEFHKKQLANQKNYTVLEKFITELYGKSKKIQLEVDNNHHAKVPSVVKPPQAVGSEELLKVSSIFAGAELIE